MTSKFSAKLKYVVSNDETRWSVVFSSDGGTVTIGLHYKKNEYPTHEFEVPIAQFQEMAKSL